MEDSAAARMRCLHSLYLAANSGDALMLCRGLVIIGGLEAAAGRFSRAARLFGAEAAGRPDQVQVATLAHPTPTDPERYAEDVASTHCAPGDEAFEEAWTQGAQPTFEEAARMMLTDRTVVDAVSA
jgi:hypothetical protein